MTDQLAPLAVPVKAACRLIGVGNTTMWALIKAGRVQTSSIGRKRLVLYSSLEKLLASPADRPAPRGRPRKIPLAAAHDGDGS